MRILKEDSVALIIDIQEKLFPVMSESEKLLQNCLKLIDGLKVLSVPLIITQQYTKGLGPTLPSVSAKINGFSYYEKTAFSCLDEPAVEDKLALINKHNVVLCGIETHVCVLQTCIDLLEKGYKPVVVEDCVSSRNLNDRNVALERMRMEGAVITTYESLLFEMTRRAGSEIFKQISGIVK